MVAEKNLYHLVVRVGENYLGPAGERFIRRQIDTHLDIKPEKLRKKDLVNLAKWSSLAFALLTKDVEQIESFKKALLSAGNASR